MPQNGKAGSAARSEKKNRKSAHKKAHVSGRFVFVLLAGIAAIIVSVMMQNSESLTLRRGEAEKNSVRLSEVMTENGGTLVSETGEVPDWIEIGNTGDETVNIGKYTMMLESSVSKLYVFPEMELGPGEYTVVLCEGSGAKGEKSAPFKLSASGGDTIVLMDRRGAIIDSVRTPELSRDESLSREEDGSWKISKKGTPGEANRITEEENGAQAEIRIKEGALELSEVMSANSLYNRDEDGEYPDYVEIHNAGEEGVDLEGWYLSDSSDKLKRWAFPQITLEADGYVVVHCSGKDRKENGAHLHSNFKISSKGEELYLSDPEGQTVSAVKVPALEEDQAYSKEKNGEWGTETAPTPWLANTAQNGVRAGAEIKTGNTGIYINEIMASPTEQKNDWIELYNSTGAAVDLTGWGLSDKASKPRKYQFPEGTEIGPGEYMGIILSGTEAEEIGGYRNADFSLAAEGGYTVCLSKPDGTIEDSVYIGRQYGGISYGRSEGREGYYYFAKGTPGTQNSGEAYEGKAERAEYTVKGGLYQTGDSFEVELRAEEGSRIYYTLDCTDPDESDTLYTGPITVSDTTILRTRVYRDGYMPSYMDTQSYLYNVNNEDNVYVVSIVSDPYNLTSDEAGIMVKGPNALPNYPFGSMNKGANFWMDWEREAHTELFAADGSSAISQECGIKLHGQYSRACVVKGIKVIARNSYGKNRFAYPIFSERDYQEYQSFVLRASGQDYNMAFMRDSLLSKLAKDTSVMYMESEPCVVYINGEYYSLMYLRERINTHSICQFEGWEGMEDDLDLVKANKNVMQGSNDSYAALLEWLKKNDTSTQQAYDVIDSVIDIQNYIEYMALEIFTGNGDTLNVKRYRNVKADGKWRWVLFDLDWAFYVDTNSIARWLNPEGMGTGMYTDTTLFRSCMKNPVFYDQFMTYFGHQLATTFASKNIVPMIEERYYLIDGLLPEYLKKIGMTESKYNKQLKKFVTYAETRPAKILEYFDGVFKFSDADKQKYFGDAVAAIREYKG